MKLIISDEIHIFGYVDVEIISQIHAIYEFLRFFGVEDGVVEVE